MKKKGNTSFIFFLRVSRCERRRVLSFFLFINFDYFLDEVKLEIVKVIWNMIHVHGNNKRTIEMSVTKEFK